MLIKIYPVLEEVAEGLPAAERLPSETRQARQLDGAVLPAHTTLIMASSHPQTP